jgi:hypothetical protein
MGPPLGGPILLPRTVNRLDGHRLAAAKTVGARPVTLEQKHPEMTMSYLRQRLFCWLVAFLLVSPLGAVAAAEKDFPFGVELMLDASPLYGSKRVPMLEIEENGTASIDLWCASLHGEATVGAKSITIVAEPPDGAQCTPERQSGDQDLLTALTQVTGWRRDGDTVEFSGPTSLRFRLMTN